MEFPRLQRQTLREWLRNLTETFPDSKFVVSSRPSAIEEDWLVPEKFSRVDVLPMELADVEIFIDRWHDAVKESAHGPDEIELLDNHRDHLKGEILQRRAIRNLATNPLLCAVICALHRDRNQQLLERSRVHGRPAGLDDRAEGTLMRGRIARSNQCDLAAAADHDVQRGVEYRPARRTRHTLRTRPERVP